MAASATPRSAEARPPSAAATSPSPHVAVAASGGSDSTALLHCVCTMATRFGLQVHALHVHHGLQPEADAWVAHLRRQLAGWARRGLPVTLHVHRLSGRPAVGESVEAWARRERRAALAAMARDADCDLMLLAHHRRDQAETVMLQALRGGGARGLSAMPRLAMREGLTWARPWIDQPRQAIESYLRTHRLQVISDPSNLDSRFARSRLRAVVMPVLSRDFPDAEACLAAVARRAAVEAAAIDEWLSRDLRDLVVGSQLDVEAWSARHPAHRHLLLRRWLAELGLARVSEAQIERLARELPQASIGRWQVSDAAELQLYRRRLSLRELGDRRGPAPAACAIDLSQTGRHDVPAWGGYFRVRKVACGLTPEDLRRATLRSRVGRERFQAGPGRPPRSLKKQFQAGGIAASERQAPLVYVGDALVYVPGLGVDARWRTSGGGASRPGLELQWHTGAPGSLGRGSRSG